MSIYRIITIFVFLLQAFLFCNPALAIRKGEAFSLNIENDTNKIGGPSRDDGYTNGIKFSYQFAQEKTPKWAPHLSKLANYIYNTPPEATNFGLSLSHKMFTPRDYSTTEFQKDDRPYAAWLSLAASVNTKTDKRSDSLEVSVGTIGPYAFGEQVQNNFHDLIDVPRAYGWSHQLYNEPTLQINYTTKRRFVDYFAAKNRMFDVIPFAGVSAGNVLIGANLGVIGRIGYNIPNDFGPTRASSTDGEMVQDPKENTSKKFRTYLFGSLRGKAIARDIFLDGNTAGGSHSVTKRNYVAETEFGFGLHYARYALIWRYVTVSPEFDEQARYQSFASINLSYFADFE